MPYKSKHCEPELLPIKKRIFAPAFGFCQETCPKQTFLKNNIEDGECGSWIYASSVTGASGLVADGFVQFSAIQRIVAAQFEGFTINWNGTGSFVPTGTIVFPFDCRTYNALLPRTFQNLGKYPFFTNLVITGVTDVHVSVDEHGLYLDFPIVAWPQGSYIEVPTFTVVWTRAGKCVKRSPTSRACKSECEPKRYYKPKSHHYKKHRAKCWDPCKSRHSYRKHSRSRSRSYSR